MKDKLFVNDGHRNYHVTWYYADIEDEGASLGDFDGDELPTGDDEHDIATRAAATCDPDGKDFAGYYWESREGARKALRAANAALKSAKSAKPWPEWAKQAAAAGWKAPKGWEP